MPGPPPKDSWARRRQNAPAGGEWIDLAPVDKPILPALPRRTKAEGPWSARTRATWASWRQDPSTTQYTSADIAYAIETAYLLEHSHRKMSAAALSEIRLRMDGLGLTPKGRRALRWRIAPPAEVHDLDEGRQRRGRAARRQRRLLSVDPGGS